MKCHVLFPQTTLLPLLAVEVQSFSQVELCIEVIQGNGEGQTNQRLNALKTPNASGWRRWNLCLVLAVLQHGLSEPKQVVFCENKGVFHEHPARSYVTKDMKNSDPKQKESFCQRFLVTRRRFFFALPQNLCG